MGVVGVRAGVDGGLIQATRCKDTLGHEAARQVHELMSEMIACNNAHTARFASFLGVDGRCDARYGRSWYSQANNLLHSCVPYE
eukprot:CAMPEP_0194779248 /NCGR_PEP_ID=MMETSP0323_2-20130528/70494_1 /TAXON_ID=2866 ORGANISM="Crypthecodinium cohnii, Strain Seligo" /NCGR_SAMPLE_ID=MMETSP0323_2 /ASSEMBLY_ACC=CAM_ASM_000346 /LENGTH=83 /DNA_ID=CAMNT_0039716795 /DNA_START=66 /DNA_END=317 /DNA_ORIENTATION=-